MNSKFDFLLSNRFWALVIGSLAVVSNGNFTKEAWANGVITLITGFISIRTVDRSVEILSPKNPPVPLNENED